MTKQKDHVTREDIILVAQYFHPEVAGTAQVLTELAIDLGRRGMRLRVITGQPSYFPGPRLPRRELHEGVEIERLPLPYLDRRKPLARIISAMIFIVSALIRLTFSRSRSRLLIATNPAALPVVGLILRKVRGQRYLCLVQDIYPEIAVRLGYLRKGSLIVRTWEKINAPVYKEADSVIVLGRCMAGTLSQMVVADGDRPRIKIIHNWADPDFIVPRRKEDNWLSARYGTIGKLTVVYSGNMGMFHDLQTLLGAARSLRGEENIQFIFIGGGSRLAQVNELVSKWSLGNVRIMPYQPKDYLPYTLTCGDVSAVTMAKDVEGLCVPGKLYTALAAGQAILAVLGRNSEIADIVTEYACGIRVDQGDVDGIVEALHRWLEDPTLLEGMKRNARGCFEEHFTKQQAMQQYYDLLHEQRTD